MHQEFLRRTENSLLQRVNKFLPIQPSSSVTMMVVFAASQKAGACPNKWQKKKNSLLKGRNREEEQTHVGGVSPLVTINIG